MQVPAYRLENFAKGNLGEGMTNLSITNNILIWKKIWEGKIEREFCSLRSCSWGPNSYTEQQEFLITVKTSPASHKSKSLSFCNHIYVCISIDYRSNFVFLRQYLIIMRENSLLIWVSYGSLFCLNFSAERKMGYVNFHFCFQIYW